MPTPDLQTGGGRDHQTGEGPEPQTGEGRDPQNAPGRDTQNARGRDTQKAGVRLPPDGEASHPDAAGASDSQITPRAHAPGTETAARLRAVIGKLSRRLRPTAAASSAGLTPTRVSVLLTVVRAGSIRLSELAASEGINPTMLSRVVSDLADDGLLERVSDENDKRAAWVQATAAGRRLSERMRRERTDAVSVAFAALSPKQRRLLEDALPALEGLAEELKLQRWGADAEGGRA